VPGSNTELVRDGFAAVTRGEFDVIAELLDPDVKWHGGDPGAGCQNRDETLAFMRGAMGRTRAELVDVIEAGPDRVVVVLQPQAEAGEPMPPRRANVTTLRDGRVVEMVAFETPEAACAAAGVPGAAG
jgi:ketosteroid isomerase-like protein